MSIAIISPDHDRSVWVDALQTLLPNLEIEVWPQITAPERVKLALCWNQPAGCLRKFPNLELISSFGAGVDHLLGDSTLPKGVPLVRLVDPDLQQSMAEYLLCASLTHFRRFKDYRCLQAAQQWQPLEIPHISELGVGILGCGTIGRFVGSRFAEVGFRVTGWSRTPQQPDGITSYAGPEQLAKFLTTANILICLLPLTSATESILNLQLFNQLPQGAYLINVGRGAHLVEADLLTALDSGQLCAALLDVFREEPLPQEHPFWTHPGIELTPHIASVTNPVSAAQQIVDNYHRILNGEPLLHQVDPERGY